MKTKDMEAELEAALIELEQVKALNKELLEALEELAAACEENHDGHDDSICSVCTLMVKAEHVIAKARSQA